MKKLHCKGTIPCQKKPVQNNNSFLLFVISILLPLVTVPLDEEYTVNDEINSKEMKELLEYIALGETDELKDVTVENGEIKAVIEIGENELIDDPRMLAEVVYSSASDELLHREGWDVLTIEFVDIGKVSMNRDQKEEYECGEYYPSLKIMKQLGIE